MIRGEARVRAVIQASGLASYDKLHFKARPIQPWHASIILRDERQMPGNKFWRQATIEGLSQVRPTFPNDSDFHQEPVLRDQPD